LSSVPPGTYVVTQSSTPSGWTLTEIFCQNPAGPNNAVVDLAGRSVSILFYPNDCYYCTFTNQQIQATNLTVVRHSDNTIWKMACGGTEVCSEWTKIGGKYAVQPTLTWDPSIQKYILIGIGNNKTSIWRSTFEADGTWNNDWTQITGASPSPVAVAAGGFNTLNPQRIALLRWYEASQAGNSFTVGTNPIGVAFDGANIWVANQSSNNVTKLRANDGSVLGTYSVGTWPNGIAFDGANIWVTNSSSNNVTKLRASDGSVLGTYSVGTNPCGIAFDGVNIWVANQNTNNLTKLRANDGYVLGTYSVGTNPMGVAFDGANIWVTNYGSNSVTKLRPIDGFVLGTYSVGTNPMGVAFDGTNIWVANYGSNNAMRLRAADGSVLGTYGVGSGPAGVAFDGANIWVANNNSHTVSKL
jgi:hypothetical protein